MRRRELPLIALVASCWTREAPEPPRNVAPPTAATPSRKFLQQHLGIELAGDGRGVRARAGAANERFVACASETATDGAIAVTCASVEITPDRQPVSTNLPVLTLEASRAIDNGGASQATLEALAGDAERFRTYLGQPTRAMTRMCAQNGGLTCSVYGTDVTVQGHSLQMAHGDGFDDIDLSVDCDAEPTHVELWGESKARVVFVIARMCGRTEVWGLQLP